MSYLQHFEAAVSAQLGGMEMAHEFFQRHPILVNRLREFALFHVVRRSSPEHGAGVFFQTVCRPTLAFDRRLAQAAQP